MAQNRSHAVMAQRTEALDSLDDFPTPPWATRAFCEHVLPRTTGYAPAALSVLEPACNRGWMAEALRPYFREVLASDIADYGYGLVADFLKPEGDLFSAPAPVIKPCWIITNPPFVRAEEFVLRGLELASMGVAILARTNFQEGVGRYERLFRDRPPTWIVQSAERIPMVKGRLNPEASTATAYSWFVWDKGQPEADPRLMWIPPSRRNFERSGDYEIPRGIISEQLVA